MGGTLPILVHSHITYRTAARRSEQMRDFSDFSNSTQQNKQQVHRESYRALANLNGANHITGRCPPNGKKCRFGNLPSLAPPVLGDAPIQLDTNVAVLRGEDVVVETNPHYLGEDRIRNRCF